MGPEKTITNKLRDWAYMEYGRADAKGDGLLLIKKLTMLGMYGEVGHPDLEFNVKGGRTFLIEMKAPGKTSTPIQRQRQDEYRSLGFYVYECDDLEEGKEFVRIEMRRIADELLTKARKRKKGAA
jgi:hypothetical protein